MIAAHRFEIAAPPPAIDVGGQHLASGSTTWTALPDLGETSFSAADSRRGLDYMHARFRSPLTGRFLSVDPAMQVKRAMKMPQLWNRYAYGVGNPLKYVDPTGKVAALTGTEEEQRKTLAALKNTVPVNLRMFVRNTTNAQGQTALDTKYLRMGASSTSGNFQSLRAVAGSDKVFSIGTSSRGVATTDGTVTLGASSSDKGIFLDDGGLSPVKGMSSVLVGGDLTQLETAKTLAHELRHASLFAEGQPYGHELGLFEESPGVFNAYDPNGPVNRSTASAQREAEANFDPFYPHN